MKAVVFRGPHTVAVEEVPRPSLHASTDAIVRVTAAGLCGSDLHIYRGREKGLDAGTIMGHEFVGTVEEVGSDVKGVSVGDRVTSPFTTNCGACFYCGTGLTARCVHGQLFGWTYGGNCDQGLQGAQAQYVRVPFASATLAKIPASVSDEGALFCGDILSTAYFCAENGGVKQGASQVVAVVGCGPVGLLTVRLAQLLGAAQVFALDLVPHRLDLARQYGATPILIPTDDADRAEAFAPIRKATDGRGADVVLEVVGLTSALKLAFSLLRPGGTLSSVGVHTDSSFDQAFTPNDAYDKNITFRSGRCSARTYMEKTIPLLEAGLVDLSGLVSHRVGFENKAVVESYDMFDKAAGGCTKVVFDPWA